MLIEGGSRRRSRSAVLSRPVRRPDGWPVDATLTGTVLSADPERCEMTVLVAAASRAEALVGHSVRARLPCHRLVDRDGCTDLGFEHLHFGDRVELRICLPARELRRPPSVLEARSALWLGPGDPAATFS